MYLRLEEKVRCVQKKKEEPSVCGKVRKEKINIVTGQVQNCIGDRIPRNLVDYTELYWRLHIEEPGGLHGYLIPL